jgi:hypothetical protein
MVASLRALLSGVIDYAGLFPPAKLHLDEAVKNYSGYHEGSESWMLGRFLCPALSARELAARLFSQSAPSPWEVAAVGQGWDSLSEFLAGLVSDRERIYRLNASASALLHVETYEVRLPPGIMSSWDVLRELRLPMSFGETADDKLTRFYEDDAPQPTPGHAEETADDKLTRFYEVPWTAEGLSWLRDMATAFGEFNATAGPDSKPLGLKFRCGGTEAAAFPPAEHLAAAVVACRDGGVPLKATAGLHHPIRRFDSSLQVTMHGFLNLFVAGVLAHARRLSEEQVCQVLLEEDAAAFRFDDQGLSWRDQRATTDEVTLARQRLMTSFGSCSFDEPRDDLRALGLL